MLNSSLASCENDFEILCSESIGEVFTSLFGERIGNELFVLLQSKHHISREEIPHRLNDFELALKGIFGPKVVIVSRIIAERLYSKLDFEFIEDPNCSLLEYATEARLLLSTSARWHPNASMGHSVAFHRT
jgi:hypothetical protein